MNTVVLAGNVGGTFNSDPNIHNVFLQCVPEIEMYPESSPRGPVRYINAPLALKYSKLTEGLLRISSPHLR
jgi:hypothetical protein